MAADGHHRRETTSITRRNLLAQTLRLGGGLALLGGSGALAACGGREEPEASGTTGGGATTTVPATTSGATTTVTTTTAAGGPNRGGVLVFGTQSPPQGFDPARWWGGLAWHGAYALFDRLLSVTDQSELVPELLEDLPEINADGTLYTFRLRPSVMFHHGRELTADDVKFSIERLVKPATASEGGSLYTGLTIPGMKDILNETSGELPGIKVLDDQTLTIELEQPDSVFLWLMALPFASIVPRDVVEKVGDKKFNFAPTGSGPFLAKEIDPGRSIVFERNAVYWNPELPYVDAVKWEIGVEPNLSILRIQRGEQDMMEEEVPLGSLAQLRDDPDLQNQLVIGAENNVYYVTLSLEHEALKDLRVRQAVAMALDKEHLIRAIAGLGHPATGGLFSPLSPYYQEGLAYPYDPEQAKQLLAEAGYADGFDVTLWGTNYTPYKEIGETTQQDLTNLGIRVDLRADIRDKWLAEVVKNPPGITENQWNLPYPHGSYIIDGAFTKAALDAGCCNFSSFISAEFDELAQQAHRETDTAKVVDLYKQMDRIVVKDEALWVPLFYSQKALLVSARLRGYTIPVTPETNTKFFAKYWLEEA